MDFNKCARGIVYFLTKSHGYFICVNLFHVASVPTLPTLNVEPIYSSSAVTNFPVWEFSLILFTGTHCTCSRRVLQGNIRCCPYIDIWRMAEA